MDGAGSSKPAVVLVSLSAEPQRVVPPAAAGLPTISEATHSTSQAEASAYARAQKAQQLAEAMSATTAMAQLSEQVAHLYGHSPSAHTQHAHAHAAHNTRSHSHSKIQQQQQHTRTGSGGSGST